MWPALYICWSCSRDSETLKNCCAFQHYIMKTSHFLSLRYNHLICLILDNIRKALSKIPPLPPSDHYYWIERDEGEWWIDGANLFNMILRLGNPYEYLLDCVLPKSTCTYLICIVNWKLSWEALSQPITSMKSLNNGNLEKVAHAEGTLWKQSNHF